MKYFVQQKFCTFFIQFSIASEITHFSLKKMCVKSLCELKYFSNIFHHTPVSNFGKNEGQSKESKLEIFFVALNFRHKFKKISNFERRWYV